MIRVLEVCYGFGYGGIQAFIINCIENIDNSKFQIDIYVFGTSESPLTERVLKRGVNIYFEPSNNVRNIKLFTQQIEAFIKKNGPYDVVHANCNLISAWVLLAAKKAGVPIRLSHSHTSNHFDGGLIQHLYGYVRRFLIYQLATNKLACGNLAGKKMYGRMADFEIINNGIDVERFINKNSLKVENLRKRLNISHDFKVYANVSRCDPFKNHLFVLDVFREIKRIERKSVLIIGGTIPNSLSTVDEIKNKIIEYGLENEVRFTGPIVEIEHLYHLSDVWIFCSKFEGLPFIPIELQAAAIPCLVSDVITKEIDLGLGLVRFMSLKENPRLWAKEAVNLQKVSLDKDRIREAFKFHNFDVRESIKKLERIYLGKNQ